ncbi:MAG: HNH endonuclease signature motif containing protein [Thermodesulfobacteriota bacterium]|nr:HNH endonuclease signature motif containing protein [Thermodesulfobacteriota bacterium]
MKDKNKVILSAFVAEEDIKREKSRARELRRSRWWHQKCAKGVCFYCGGRVGPSNLTMDHVVPLIRGGKSVKGNLVPACRECNNKKKYLLPMEWEEYTNSHRAQKVS